MSRNGELGVDFAKLPEILASYEESIVQAKEILPIKGKTLEQAFKEQCQWPFHFGQQKAELKALLNYFEMKVAAARGGRYRFYVELYPRAVGERIMDKLVNDTPEYLSIQQLYIEVEELYDIFCEIMDGFDKRGFALRDFTAARVAEFHRDQIV